MSQRFPHQDDNRAQNLEIALLNMIQLAEGGTNARTDEEKLVYQELIHDFKRRYVHTLLDGKMEFLDERIDEILRIVQLVYELHPNYHPAELPGLIHAIEELRKEEGADIEPGADISTAFEIWEMLSLISDDEA